MVMLFIVLVNGGQRRQKSSPVAVLEILNRNQQWTCDFVNKSMCNIRNQPSMPMNFIPLPDETFNGRRGLYYLSHSVHSCAHGGARLYTPYFRIPSEWPACFELSYWAFGNALHSMSIYQQDEGGRRIWHRDNLRTSKHDCWMTATINVTPPIKRMPTRFFVEAKFGRSTPTQAGFVFLSHLSVMSRQCTTH